EELGLSDEDRRLGDIAAWLGGQALHPDAIIERLVW
ncbi:TIGR01459 family HAD-type hydrolase, partial [Methylobacterium trifolii]